jgi:cytochrome c556
MRSKHLWGAALSVPVLLTLSACAPAPETTGSASGPTFKPVISINEAMVDVVDHNSHILWNVGDPAKAPKTEADWHNLEHASATLAAAGSIMAVGGSAPGDEKWAREPKWAELNQKMTDAALKIKLAVDSKNLSGVLAGGDDLVMSCEGCHAEYKLKIPAHVATKDQQPEHFGH